MSRLLALAAAVLLLFGGAAARGSAITLTTSNPTGTPLVVNQGTTGAASMLIKIINDANPDPPASFMTAWQFQISIVADGGATGTLTFNQPTTSSPPNPSGPPPYIFASGLGILATKSAGNTVLDANDFDRNSAGTQVPTTPGASLLQV